MSARKKVKPVKAWGLLRAGKLLPLTGRNKKWMTDNYTPYAEVVRVEIRVVKP